MTKDEFCERIAKAIEDYYSVPFTVDRNALWMQGDEDGNVCIGYERSDDLLKYTHYHYVTFKDLMGMVCD